RYFETERGYQGALIAELQRELVGFNWDQAIIEQEYQKRIREHGVTVRPDIIIHVPFSDYIHNSRIEGNFVVFELKLNACEHDAIADYESLSRMCAALNYPLAIFININSNNTYIDSYQGNHKDKLVSYSVQLADNRAVVTKVEPNT
ncbi:MAG: hypothetical protein U9R28_00830, partial [Pseudomonadota bacterium]|nr:hypothetical protein [Pseudomonadota bacterium]